MGFKRIFIHPPAERNDRLTEQKNGWFFSREVRDWHQKARQKSDTPIPKGLRAVKSNVSHMERMNNLLACV